MSRAGLQITERDRTLLTTLERYRFLTAAQLQRLSFPSKHTCLRRILKLEAAGLVARTRADSMLQPLVTLTRRGAALIGNDVSGAKRIVSDLFLRHAVELNDFRIALEQACAQRSDVQLGGFVPDLASHASRGRQPERVLGSGVFGGAVGSHTPDAAFVLQREGRAALFFLEIDRGTEVIGDVKRGVGRAITYYLQAFAGTGFQSLSSLFDLPEQFRTFRVLFVTTSSARIKNIRTRWGAGAGTADRRFVWLATKAVSHTTDLFAEEWVTLESSDAHAYTMMGRPREATHAA